MSRTIEPRRAARLCLAMPGRLKTDTGLMDCVAVLDLSIVGCRIASLEIELAQGQALTLRPDRIEAIKGRVRWIQGHRAGIEFERPLYLPVVEHLQKVWPMPLDEAGANWVTGQGPSLRGECPPYMLAVISRARALQKEQMRDSLARLTEAKVMGLRLRYC